MCIECSILWATDTLSEYVNCIAFHYNNVCTKAPQCYVMPTLPVLFPAAAQSSFFMFLHVSATHRGATLLKKAVYRFLKRCLCFYNTVATVWFAETRRVENICVQ